jgi:hypothetical protein
LVPLRQGGLQQQKSENNKIGGPSIIIEIDENKGKRKLHKGRPVDGLWVFGGIKRNWKKCFFTTVENRAADTLVNIISSTSNLEQLYSVSVGKLTAQ